MNLLVVPCKQSFTNYFHEFFHKVKFVKMNSFVFELNLNKVSRIFSVCKIRQNEGIFVSCIIFHEFISGSFLAKMKEVLLCVNLMQTQFHEFL